MNKEKIKNILNSRDFRIVLYTTLSLAVLFCIFHLGTIAGHKRAMFNCNWGRNYEANFGAPRMNPLPPNKGRGEFRNFPNANGSIGKIIKISLPNVIVFDDKESTEKVVVIDEKTQIRKARETITKEELKLEDAIVVVGNPNDKGQIEAKLIRVLPVPLEDSFN